MAERTKGSSKERKTSKGIGQSMPEESKTEADRNQNNMSPN